MKPMQLRVKIEQLKRIGLQRRIMLYVTGGLIVVMAAYSAVSLQAINRSTALVFRERLIVAGTVARQMDGDLSLLQGDLNDLVGVASLALADHQPSQAQEAMHTLRQHWLSYDHFNTPCAIILTDPNGKVLWSDPPPSELPSRDFSNRPAFREALQSLRPFTADEYSSEANGHGSLLLAAPVLVSGQIAGVLLGDLNLSYINQRFSPLFEKQKIGYSQDLVNEDGMVIASTQPENQWKLSDHFPLIKDMLALKQSGTATHQMPKGSAEPTHIIAFVPLSAVPWGVVVEEPQDAALALPHALDYQLFFFGVIVLLLGLILAWVTTRAVVQPVNALIDATQQIAAGDLDHPLDVAAEDEVGRLARSFDEMREELKQSREEIANFYHELEERVRQRTRELSALIKSSQALAAILNLDVLFEILIKETHAVMPSAEGIAFFLFDKTNGLLTVHSTFGFDAAECERLGFRIGEGIAGRVFEAQSPVRLGLAQEIRAAQSNIQAENYACFQRAIGERPVQSALGAPLISKGVRLGALVLYNLSRENAFSENDVTVLQAFAYQATTAIENARLYASLQEKEAARAALLEQVIQAQEEERARVAREIHDELGQLLTRLNIDLKMCEMQIAAKPGQAAETLAATQSLVWQTMEQAHRLIVELRPTLLDELGLEAALREELSARLEPLGVSTTLEADGEPERLPPSVEITVFRIAQEAISNVARHAHARQAILSLHAAGSLEVCIEDDGVGISGDWQSGNNGHRPLGLLGMQERAALIGGTLSIEPGKPQGTRVILRLPLDSDAPLEKKTP